MPYSRQETLAHPDVLDCTIYRPDEHDPDVEEQDLGDARILITGSFEPPVEWDARQREDYFGEEDPTHFVMARIESLGEPGKPDFFQVDNGDYVAVQVSLSEVVMYYVYDHEDDEHGRHYVLIRDDEEL
ncbi:hypothetical protein [Pseudomonas sp. NCCP-436]|uniref:hypothetical protein n=1 Tax=Pseudomonas sp. NCCP-436 TaxID=2842481 RepID=UPI001C7E6EA0|nr:hypothetical protein [Pseudomonas sp. NCCP-436]GIZ13982.1 hypothetical protein NCCP436_33980 [Pseudomonas sp. NCCP-436]